MSSNAKEKVLFHLDSVSSYKSMKTMVKLSELRFELLSHPQYSPYLPPSDYMLFEDLKRMLQGKRFGANEEVIAKVEAYFDIKDKWFCQQCIKTLEKHWAENALLLRWSMINTVQF
ncbi:putative mariner transposase [Trichonephila clavipes]|nr:putative mariner transposase [Trichonephila clavipes]